MSVSGTVHGLAPAWPRAARAPPASARSGADRPQPGATTRPRSPCREAVFRRPVLPDPARGREGRRCLDVGARRVAFRQRPHGRARRTPAARRARFARRAARATLPDRCLRASGRVSRTSLIYCAGRRWGISAAWPLRRRGSTPPRCGLRGSLGRRRPGLSRGRKLALRLQRAMRATRSACVTSPGREPSARARPSASRHSASLFGLAFEVRPLRACLGLRLRR